MAAFLSGTGGFIWCHRLAFQRLKGFRENSQELLAHGINPERKLVAVVRKRAVLTKEELQQI
jgi:hypothetical protein